MKIVWKLGLFSESFLEAAVHAQIADVSTKQILNQYETWKGH